MKLLLDTHAALWWWADSPRLSTVAREAMIDTGNELFFSAISAFEIFQKVRTKKLTLPPELERDFPAAVIQEGWQVLPVSVVEAIHAARPEHPHRDPFDRILAAQAKVNYLTILTTDPFFAGMGIPVLW